VSADATQATSDEALVALVEQLYERYYMPLFGYVYHLVHDAAWAHDLVQETFLRLYRERAKLRAVENLRAWLYAIASNVTFKALRKRSRGERFLRQQAGETAQPDPNPTARAGQEHVSVARALAALPPHYRAPLLLHSYFGFPIRETAAALSLSETAVTTRIYRAKKMFREAYQAAHERGNE
jgi:RNA polymerase sigma-70 factor (ECF subfamily)